MAPQIYEYYEYYEYCVGGIYSHRPVHPACVSQRFARRLGGGPAVVLRARGTFTRLA